MAAKGTLRESCDPPVLVFLVLPSVSSLGLAPAHESTGGAWPCDSAPRLPTGQPGLPTGCVTTTGRGGFHLRGEGHSTWSQSCLFAVDELKHAGECLKQTVNTKET